MRKFKVGDRVKVIFRYSSSYNKITTITKISKYGSVICSNGTSWGSPNTSLELYKPVKAKPMSAKESISF